jgi:hypothetical protein
VLLVSGSSVGQTRCAVEVVTALPPDWWLVHPAGSAELAAGGGGGGGGGGCADGGDELQRYPDGEHRPTGVG